VVDDDEAVVVDSAGTDVDVEVVVDVPGTEVEVVVVVDPPGVVVEVVEDVVVVVPPPPCDKTVQVKSSLAVGADNSTCAFQ
jgi:hypothetical protein